MKKILAVLTALIVVFNCSSVCMAIESTEINTFLDEFASATKPEQIITTISQNTWAVSNLEQYIYYIENDTLRQLTAEIFVRNGVSFAAITDFQNEFEINVLLARASKAATYSEMHDIICRFERFISIGEYASLPSSQQTKVCNAMKSANFTSIDTFRSALVMSIDKVAHSTPSVGGDSSYPSSGGGNPINAKLDYCYYEGNTIYSKLVFDKNSADSIMYVGVYHIDGYLKQIKKYSVSAGVTGFEFQIGDYVHNNVDVLKVFFFDAQDGITPLGSAVDVVLKEFSATANGVVLGVIDYTLNGASVKKTQVLIGDEAYGIGKYSVDTLKEMVGYSVTFMFNAKDEITNIRKQSGENELITVDADMIVSVSDTTIAYYQNEDDEYDDKTTALSLGDMYVVYNGVPVNPADIGAGFDISDRLNVTDGKITFLSNDGNAKDAEVAFVESYVTYLANARPAENNGIWTLYDKFADKTGITPVNLDEDTTIVKRITSKGGSLSFSTLGAITEYDVVSVAMPYGTTENATVIISSVKPTETVQEMNSDYSYVKTNSGEYEVSPYFRTLQDKDVDVSFGNGDSGIFYFDRQGRIAYYKENRAVSPYKLAVRYATKSEGVGLTYVLHAFEKGTNGFVEYTLNDSVRVNNTAMTAAEAVAHLEANAPKDYTGDYDNYIIQPVRLYTNSKGLVNAIDCMDSANDYAAGNVIPTAFENSVNSSATVFSNGGTLKYVSSVKSFNHGYASQFRISSAVVFAVPAYNLSAQNQYKIYTAFENGGEYCVEAYDGKNAGAVIYYYNKVEDILSKIYTDTSVSIIESVGSQLKDGETVKTVSYYKADGTLTSNVIDDEVKPAYLNDIKAGDLVKLAITDGKITTIQPVYMGGKLYSYDGSAPLTSGVNHFKVSYDDKAGYYQAMVGAVQSFDYEGKFVEIIPTAVADGSYNADNTLQLLLSGSAKYYKQDKNGKVITAEYGDFANEALEVKPATTTRVVAIVMNEAIVAMYMIPAESIVDVEYTVTVKGAGVDATETKKDGSIYKLPDPIENADTFLHWEDKTNGITKAAGAIIFVRGNYSFEAVFKQSSSSDGEGSDNEGTTTPPEDDFDQTKQAEVVDYLKTAKTSLEKIEFGVDVLYIMCDTILDTIDKTLNDATQGIKIYEDDYIETTYADDIASIRSEYSSWNQNTKDRFISKLATDIESYIAEYLFDVIFGIDINDGLN